MSDFDKVKAAYDQVAQARRTNGSDGSSLSGLVRTRSRGDSDMSAIIVENQKARLPPSNQRPGVQQTMSFPNQQTLVASPSSQTMLLASPSTEALLRPSNDAKIIQRAPSPSVPSVAAQNQFATVVVEQRQNGTAPSGLGEAVMVGTLQPQPKNDALSPPEVLRTSVPDTFPIGSIQARQTPIIQQSPTVLTNAAMMNNREPVQGLGDAVVIGGIGAKADSVAPQQSMVSQVMANDRPLNPGMGERATINFQKDCIRLNQEYYPNGTRTYPTRMTSVVGTLDAKMPSEQQPSVQTVEYRSQYPPPPAVEFVSASAIQYSPRPLPAPEYKHAEYKGYQPPSENGPKWTFEHKVQHEDGPEMVRPIRVPDHLQSYDPNVTLPPVNWTSNQQSPANQQRPPELVPEPISMNDVDSMDNESLKDELAKLRRENQRWQEYAYAAGTDSAKAMENRINEVRKWSVSEYQQLQQSRQTLQADKDQLQKRHDRLKKQVSDEEHNNRRLEHDLHYAQNDLGTRDKRIQRARQDLAEMNQGLTNLKNQVMRPTQETSEARRAIDDLRREKDQLCQRISQLREKERGNGELRDRLSSAREQRIEDEIAILKRANRALEIEIDTMQSLESNKRPPASPQGLLFEQWE